MKIGIVGLPNVGKSSLFNLLTKTQAQVANFPFTTIDRNIGMAFIPDERLDNIVKITKSPKMKYAQIEFVDIAGLIKGASHGDGLGNKFLAHIRDVDLIVHVVRCFMKEDIPHTFSDINPQRDYEIVRTELLLADLAITERRIEKIKKKHECKKELQILEEIKGQLSRGVVPQISVHDLPLLSTKEEIIVLNIDENRMFHNKTKGYRLSIKLEEDIMDFNEQERMELREEIGIDTQGLTGLINHCLDELSIILFYTIKGDEARAWPITAGTRIVDAAGKIHTDMSKGFIKAEVINYRDFITSGGFSQAQHTGKTKIEGKEYIVQDGDIILIRFRV
jgi:GTP-binding protein YchF